MSNLGSQYFESVIETFMWESKVLENWFKKEYPESDLKVILDANNVLRSLKVTVRVLMGEEIVKNRGYFESVILLSERQVFDKRIMSGFLKVFNEQFRKSISHAINNHYAVEKAKQQSSSTTSS